MTELDFDELAEETRGLLNEIVENIRTNKVPLFSLHALYHEMEKKLDRSIPLYKRMEKIRDEIDDDTGE